MRLRRVRPGGDKSVEVRRQRKAINAIVETALGKLKDGVPMADIIFGVSLLQKAQEGDVKAMELVLKIIGEMPSDKMEVTGRNGEDLFKTLPSLTPDDLAELQKLIK